MERIEVGHQPPLHPQLQSREPALLPRTEITQIPFSSLLKATCLELQKSVRVIPSRKIFTAYPFNIGLHVAGIASTNGIREEDFRRNFPNFTLRRLTSNEAHTTDPFLDARSKALSAAANERQDRKAHPIRKRLIERQFWKANPIVGLDAVNAIPTVQQDGHIGFTRIGKPERVSTGHEIQTIQERFATLAKMAKDNNWPSVPYVIEMATYIHNARRQNQAYDAYSIRNMVVLLDPEKLAYLATPEGFAKYQSLAETTLPMLSKTAGGMKIETFRELGVIQYITEDPIELALGNLTQTDQQKAYKKAEILALGKLDIHLFGEYTSLFPPTLSKRLGIRRKSVVN